MGLVQAKDLENYSVTLGISYHIISLYNIYAGPQIRVCTAQLKITFLISQPFQASKYLKIGTCPASQNLLAYMGKI